MKKIIFLHYVLIVALSSCKKETPMQTNTINNSTELVYKLDNIRLKQNTQNIRELIKNPYDADDEKLNGYQLELSIAIVDLIKNPKFNRTIIEMAKRRNNKTASLLDLRETAPNFYKAIDDKLANRGLSMERIAANFTHKPVSVNSASKTDMETEYYIPAIFIPNIDIADINKQPLLSANVYVNSQTDSTLEDNIIASYYTQEGQLKETLIDEATSLITSNPLFLIVNSTLEDIRMNNDVLPPNDGSSQKVASTTSFHSNEYRVNSGYEYENMISGKCEFCVVAYYIDPGNVIHWIYDSYGWKKIAAISKSNIGRDLGAWTSHCSNYLPYTTNFVFWNTFERDWSYSQKPIGTGTRNGVTIFLSGNMRYSNEWYTFDPTTVTNNPTDLNYIYWNWAKWHNSYKANFRIWRVEL